MVLIVKMDNEEIQKIAKKDGSQTEDIQAGRELTGAEEAVATGLVAKFLYQFNRYAGKAGRALSGWDGRSLKALKAAEGAKGLGKIIPGAATVITAVESIDVANKAINSKSLQEAAEVTTGGFLGIGADLGLLGGLIAFGPPGWVAAAGYAAIQGGSYLLTGKTVGQHVGDLGVWGVKSLEKKFNWLPDNDQVASKDKKKASEPLENIELPDKIKEAPQLASLKESLPPIITLPGGGVITRGGASMEGNFRPNAPYPSANHHSPSGTSTGHSQSEDGRVSMG